MKMKKSTSFAISAAAILLALVLPFHAYAQTAFSPQTTTTQQMINKSPLLQKPAINPAINPAIIPTVGSAVISVRDSVGSPVGAAMVSMTVSGQSATQQTNAQGEASFINIPSGQYSYSVTKTGYYSPIPSMALTISRGAAAASNFILFQYGSAKVKVTSNGSPVAGANVSVTGNGKNLSGTTDAGGFASFSSLNQGSYLFSTGMAGYVNTQSNVNIPCGQETAVPVAISRFGSAKVKVTCNGSPVEQAFVNVIYSNSSYSKATDASGVTTFSNMPQGSYVFKVTKTDCLGSQVTANVAGGQEATVPMTVALNLGTLVLTVKDPNFNELVSGAAVTLTSATGTIQSGTTNAQGVATFGSLKVGTYKVAAVKDGYSPLSANTSIGISGAQPYLLNYSLVKLYTNVIVTVQKQGTQAGPVLLEGVALNLLGSGASQTKATDSRGQAVLTYLQPGDYIVSAGKAGYINSSKDIHIVRGNSITVIYLMIEMPAVQ